MKAKPILFSGPMVKAILDGRKTQTRRIIKPQPPVLNGSWHQRKQGHYWHDPKRADYFYFVTPSYKENTLPPIKCPYPAAQKLWVRETWAPCIGGPCEPGNPVLYRADGFDSYEKLTWKPSIFMPRWASRITLEITNIKVERLQDISEEDAKAEGVTSDCPIGHIPAYDAGPYQYCFAQLWESINGPDSWQKNPYVWCISFRRVELEKPL